MCGDFRIPKRCGGNLKSAAAVGRLVKQWRSKNKLLVHLGHTQHLTGAWVSLHYFSLLLAFSFSNPFLLGSFSTTPFHRLTGHPCVSTTSIFYSIHSDILPSSQYMPESTHYCLLNHSSIQSTPALWLSASS